MNADWMLNATFLAEAGHTLAGWLVPVLFAYFGGLKWLAYALSAFFTYAVLKEFWFDLHFETGETFLSSLLDFGFYMLGCLLAFVTVAVRTFLVRVTALD